MRYIRLGLDRNDRPVYFPESGSYNVVFIIAKPRYGKSVIVKNLYSQISEDRGLIIFDYQGEHSDSKWGNWRSKGKTAFVPDLYTVEDFGFYMSDFDEMADWVSMGFSDKSAPLLMELLKFTNIYQNDPFVFLEMLRDLPSRDYQIDYFNEKYNKFGLQFRDRIHDSTKHSMISAMNNVVYSGLIIPPETSVNYDQYADGRRHIEEWGELAGAHWHTNINLNIVTGGSVQLARAGVGKILSHILPYLRELRPLIVVEEADYIVPNGGDESVTSLYQLRHYVLKHQRTGVELMFISQDPNLLDQFTLMGGTIWIMGPHTPSFATNAMLDETNTKYNQEIIHQLRFDKETGLREFALMIAGDGGKYEIFRADDSCTRI